MTVPPATPVGPNFHVNPFFQVGIQYPRRPLIHPAPTSVTYPFGQSGPVPQEAALAYPVVIETFRRLAEAVLAYVQPQELPPEGEAPQAPGRPGAEELRGVRGTLLFLQGEIQKAFQPPKTLPKEIFTVLLQIPKLLEQVERLLQEVERPPEPGKPPLPAAPPRAEAPATPQPPGELPVAPKRVQPEAPRAPTVEVPRGQPREVLPERPLPAVGAPPLPEKAVVVPRAPSFPGEVLLPGKPPQPGGVLPGPPPLPREEVSEPQAPTTAAPQRAGAFQELQRALPSFVQTLSRAFPFLPGIVTPQVRETLLAPFLPQVAQRPVVQAPQAGAPLPIGAGVLERKVAIEEGLRGPGYFLPSIVGTPVVVRRGPVEVIARTYPTFVPIAEVPITVTPVVPKGQAVPLPPVLPGIPIPREVGLLPHIENVRLMPPFSTEIPFAFIVPYQSYFPIKSYPSAAALPKIEVRPIVEDKEGGEGEEGGIQLLSYVPEGDTLFGDPFNEGELDERPLRKLPLRKFAIGTYLVTVQQYADFLTSESKRRGVHLDSKGFVFSSGGTLLCQVKSGNGASDLEAQQHDRYLGFKPVLGKEFYPVTFVSYLGAKAFCEAGGFRLPKEVEWEKAAGVKVDVEKRPVQKFRYGFSKDEIDPSLASYASGGKEFLETTPVGFYNGRGVCSKGGSFFSTSNAVSPFGCYDMSGNVWEWTSTEEGSGVVVKGGCFESPPKEVRVSARKLKDPDVLDRFTGFRVALS